MLKCRALNAPKHNSGPGGTSRARQLAGALNARGKLRALSKPKQNNLLSVKPGRRGLPSDCHIVPSLQMKRKNDPASRKNNLLPFYFFCYYTTSTS